MTIHRIRLLGDPILRARCEPITKPKSTAVRVILDDMRETLRDWQSRFGSGRAIAAPQIGAPVRMVYVEMEKPWPLINPEIVDIGTEALVVEKTGTTDEIDQLAIALAPFGVLELVRTGSIAMKKERGEWRRLNMTGTSD
jgi:acetolactate synthase small subunit